MTKTIDDGGPAFASDPFQVLPDGHLAVRREGISARDYFAAQALAGFCANPAVFAVRLAGRYHACREVEGMTVPTDNRKVLSAEIVALLRGDGSLPVAHDALILCDIRKAVGPHFYCLRCDDWLPGMKP